MLLLRVRQQQVALLVQVVYLLLHRLGALDALVLEVDVRAGLVDEVDGLVGQVAVGYIALAHEHGLAAHLPRDAHLVALLVVVGDALDYLHAVLYRGLGHGDGLEAALKGGVLLDVLAVFGEGGGADDLYLAAAERGLEDVGGVHAALRVPRADQVVHLVYHQDDVARLAYLLDEALHAALELAAELRAGHQRGEVEEVYLLVAQLIGHGPRGDALGQALGDGRLAHAGLADQAGVVLLPAVEDLYHALELLLAADHGVQLALARAVGQVDAVVVEKLALGALRGALGRLLRAGGGGPAALLHRAVLPCGQVAAAAAVPAAEEAVEEGEGGGLALVLVVRAVAGVGEGLRPAEGVHHLAGERVEVLVGKAHAVYHVVHGLDVQLAGALQAEALVLGLAVLDFGYEYHGHVLVAA